MGKLLLSDSLELNLRAWAREDVTQVFAGMDCAMALTADGRTLQVSADPRLAPRTAYWTRIRQIALSSCCSCLALGLVADGTCLVAKRPLRRCCEIRRGIPFETVNDTVKSWRGIVQTAASDALFALDGHGQVHMAYISRDSGADYDDAKSWQGVRRLAVGIQNALFGVTEEGRVLCAGRNLLQGGRGDMRRYLDGLRDVVDVASTGGEATRLFIAFRDGSVRDLDGSLLPVTAAVDPQAGPQPVFASHFWHTVCLRDRERRLRVIQGDRGTPAFPGRDVPVASFALAGLAFNPPGIVAVAE